jgi:NADH-quinone oxidoreductase subunit J
MSDLASALVFWPAAVLMLVTGLYVFRTSSMARAGLLLLAALAIEGLVFLALASEFLGVLQLLMMSGEMVIMVFFMVMFMPDPGGLMGMEMVHDKSRSAAVAASVGVALALVAVVTDWPARVVGSDAPDVRAIGFEVMGR